jgi:single-strand DNA-binding protein
MAGEPPITLIGNLTGDPELRFTPSGAAVANFTVACTPRTLDRQSNEWKDGETLFISCSVWRQVAENVAESLTRGARVVVHGRLKARSYDDRDGNKRTVFECDVEEIGASMRYATLKISKTSRSDGGGFGGGGNQGGGNQGGGYGGGQAAAPQNDPWATPQGQQGGGGQAAPQNDPWASQGGGSMEEPPF